MKAITNTGIFQLSPIPHESRYSKEVFMGPALAGVRKFVV